MSQSPEKHESAGASALGRAYEAGWVAVHRLIREGMSWSGRERKCFFLNTGAARFANVSALSGIDFPDDGRALARCDWDNDGKLDLWLANRNAPRLRFLHNQVETDNSFVELRLRGTKSNRDAIGARAELVIAGESRKWIDAVRAGEGYLAQSTKTLHFGVPHGAKVERAIVRWPSGLNETFEGLTAGAIWTLVEGSGRAERWTPPAAKSAIAASNLETPKESERAHVGFAARPPFPSLEAFDSNGKSNAFGAHARPMLVLLWATWCAPCMQELGELAQHQAELDALGVDIVAVSLDEASARQDALLALQKLKWPFGVAFASNEFADRLDVLQRALLDRKRRLALPTSFLVDANNRVAALQKGALDLEPFRSDVQHLGGDERSLRDVATPFAGRWLGTPPKPDLALLARAYRVAGFEELAREVDRAALNRIETSHAKVLYDMGIVRDGQNRPKEASELFAQALAAEPDYFDARAALGYALHEQGMLREAIVEYRRALHLKPDHAPTIFNLGLALVQNGERDAAAAQLAILSAIDPQSATELAAKLSSAKQ